MLQVLRTEPKTINLDTQVKAVAVKTNDIHQDISFSLRYQLLPETLVSP